MTGRTTGMIFIIICCWGFTCGVGVAALDLPLLEKPVTPTMAISTMYGRRGRTPWLQGLADALGQVDAERRHRGGVERYWYISVEWSMNAGSNQARARSPAARTVTGPAPAGGQVADGAQPGRHKPRSLTRRVRPRSTWYRMRKTGIWMSSGRHPPSGLMLFSL